MLEINGTPVEDTYCEAFDGVLTRMIITAADRPRLEGAAQAATALPCTVFGESEGGIESYLESVETPDGREGALIQVWANKTPQAADVLGKELGKRIRQGILVVPTTRVFNALESGDRIDTMDDVGHCGDGYEYIEKRYGRRMINIPLMMGEFLVEEYLGCSTGIMGGNIWLMCDSMESALGAGDRAVEAIKSISGVITAFDICSAGSKVETNYPEIGPTTNHWYCPTLKGRIEDSKVPDGVESIPEIVINGIGMGAVMSAMKAGMQASAGVDGIMRISAGNYGGKLGSHKIMLRDVLK